MLERYCECGCPSRWHIHRENKLTLCKWCPCREYKSLTTALAGREEYMNQLELAVSLTG